VTPIYFPIFIQLLLIYTLTQYRPGRDNYVMTKPPENYNRRVKVLHGWVTVGVGSQRMPYTGKNCERMLYFLPNYPQIAKIHTMNYVEVIVSENCLCNIIHLKKILRKPYAFSQNLSFHCQNGNIFSILILTLAQNFPMLFPSVAMLRCFVKLQLFVL